jgi:hypothetical protein
MMRIADGWAIAVVDHPTVFPATLPGVPPFDAERGSWLSEAMGALE